MSILLSNSYNLYIYLYLNTQVGLRNLGICMGNSKNNHNTYNDCPISFY